MPSIVHDHQGYQIRVYSPSDHYAVILPPGSNAVISLRERTPRSTSAEGPQKCIERAREIIDGLAAGGD